MTLAPTTATKAPTTTYPSMIERKNLQEQDTLPSQPFKNKSENKQKDTHIQ